VAGRENNMSEKKVLFFLLFIFSILYSLFSPVSAARIERGPYIENMSKETANLRFRTDVATVSWLTYGDYPDCDRFATVSRITGEHSVNLNGLLADTSHCYRIYLPVDGSTNSYKAEESYFKTFKDDKSVEFSFLAFGPSGMPEEDEKIAGLMSVAGNADFVLHTGNLAGMGKDEDAETAYFSRYRDMLKKTPFFVALGNYEYGPDYDKKESWKFIRENYFPYHSWPRNGSGPYYYYFDTANARFAVLDANLFYGALSAPPLAKDSQQYKWLEIVLKTAADKTWKFVAVHQPLYSSAQNGPAPGLKEALAPLLEKYGVDIVFQGHAGVYERTKPLKADLPDEDGVIYVTLGGGGGRKMEAGEDEDEDWTEAFSSNPHYSFITVQDKKLEMKVHDSGGEVLDEIIIQK